METEKDPRLAAVRFLDLEARASAPGVLREKDPRVTGTGASHKPPKFIETTGGLVLVGSALPQDLG